MSEDDETGEMTLEHEKDMLNSMWGNRDYKCHNCAGNVEAVKQAKLEVLGEVDDLIKIHTTEYYNGTEILNLIDVDSIDDEIDQLKQRINNQLKSQIQGEG